MMKRARVSRCAAAIVVLVGLACASGDEREQGGWQSSWFKPRKAVFANTETATYIVCEFKVSSRSWFRDLLIRWKGQPPEAFVVFFTKVPKSGEIFRCDEHRPCKVYGVTRLRHVGFLKADPFKAVLALQRKPTRVCSQLTIWLPSMPRDVLGKIVLDPRYLPRVGVTLPRICVRKDPQAVRELLRSVALAGNPGFEEWLKEINSPSD